MLKYLVPEIEKSDLGVMLGCSLVGALVAGIYGIVHDQITFSISREYFSQYKFAQFQYADFGWGDRGFAATVGFLATWWVGLIVGWILARCAVPNQSRTRSLRRSLRRFATGVAIVFGSVFLFGVAGYCYAWAGAGVVRVMDWEWIAEKYGIDNIGPFMQVAWIHNAGYLGVLAGLVLAVCWIRSLRGGKG